MHSIRPAAYSGTRNFSNGAVTYLGPYISRGVITTRMVYDQILEMNIPWKQAEKLVQELAWRDYWQNIWIEKGEEINQDLRNKQFPVSSSEIPNAIVHAQTGIDAVDSAIQKLYATGYMHNHMRMYVASICCNLAQCHWLTPAKWLYSHLLDGDVGSNQLSWQWVCGSNSNKKYYANQSNINRYFYSSQKRTFLDVSYEVLSSMEVPEVLRKTISPQFDGNLPSNSTSNLEKERATVIYNYYNLDPFWHRNESVQRVFLIEPSVFAKYPISKKCMDFALQLGSNIPELNVYVGEFDSLQNDLQTEEIVFKEHPLSSHYNGQQEPRTWLTNTSGYHRSFFAFWKKCKKELEW